MRFTLAHVVPRLLFLAPWYVALQGRVGENPENKVEALRESIAILFFFALYQIAWPVIANNQV